MDTYNLICRLLEEPVEQEDNSIIFTSNAKELIHQIAEKCNEMSIVQDTLEQAGEYAKELTAEQIYVDMLNKIASAPTSVHMILSAKILIPAIDRKLKEAGKAEDVRE